MASQVVIPRIPCTRKKDFLKIGTWNVRSMLKSGKLANVIQEMRQAKLDVLGLTEVRWKDGGEFITKDNVRRTNTREKRQWKTKNYVLGLVVEDGGRQDQL